MCEPTFSSLLPWGSNLTYAFTPSSIQPAQRTRAAHTCLLCSSTPLPSTFVLSLTSHLSSSSTLRTSHQTLGLDERSSVQAASFTELLRTRIFSFGEESMSIEAIRAHSNETSRSSRAQPTPLGLRPPPIAAAPKPPPPCSPAIPPSSPTRVPTCNVSELSQAVAKRKEQVIALFGRQRRDGGLERRNFVLYMYVKVEHAVGGVLCMMKFQRHAAAFEQTFAVQRCLRHTIQCWNSRV